jgi:uncharacterized protein YaiL (DUF2058 family)
MPAKIKPLFVTDAMRILGIGQSAVSQAVTRGRLTVLATDANGRYLLDPASIAHYAATRTKGPKRKTQQTP